MAQIGTFTRDENGNFAGTIKTLSLSVKASIRPSANDERTAKRISDALGTATEQRAMRNYAGHRLAPWLAHVMVSRQETARPLLTPGEVMQLPAGDELVLVSGLAPIRANKLRYFEDPAFSARICPPPVLVDAGYADRPGRRSDDWGAAARGTDIRLLPDAEGTAETENSHGVTEANNAGAAEAVAATDEGGVQQERHPGLAEEAAVACEPMSAGDPLGLGEEEDGAADQRAMDRVRGLDAVGRAHALNEGQGPDDDLVPSF